MLSSYYNFNFCIFAFSRWNKNGNSQRLFWKQISLKQNIDYLKCLHLTVLFVKLVNTFLIANIWSIFSPRPFTCLHFHLKFIQWSSRATDTLTRCTRPHSSREEHQGPASKRPRLDTGMGHREGAGDEEDEALGDCWGDRALSSVCLRRPIENLELRQCQADCAAECPALLELPEVPHPAQFQWVWPFNTHNSFKNQDFVFYHRHTRHTHNGDGECYVGLNVN